MAKLEVYEIKGMLLQIYGDVMKPADFITNGLNNFGRGDNIINEERSRRPKMTKTD